MVLKAIVVVKLVGKVPLFVLVQFVSFASPPVAAGFRQRCRLGADMIGSRTYRYSHSDSLLIFSRTHQSMMIVRQLALARVQIVFRDNCTNCLDEPSMLCCDN